LTRLESVRFVAEMPNASAALLDHFPAFLERLPPCLDVEALARQTKAFVRARGIRSGSDLLRLALAWACGGHSMAHVVAWAGERGIATLTDEALLQRLHGAGRFLQALSEQLLASVGEVPAWRGRTLRIADSSSSLSQPAGKGMDWRVHGVFDLGLGGFCHLEVTDGRGAEALDRGGGRDPRGRSRLRQRAGLATLPPEPRRAGRSAW
jgi:hypothetical protein